MDSNLFWCIVGIIGGAIVSLFFYIIGSKRKIIEYNINSEQLISTDASLLDGIDVIYNSQPISELYRTTISFINTGNSNIELNDFSTKNPLSIIVSNGKFLSSDIAHYKNGGRKNYVPCDVHTTIYQQKSKPYVYERAAVKFEYIAPKQSIKCIVYHTGDLQVYGDLKEGKLVNKTHKKRNLSILEKGIFSLLSIIILVILITVAYAYGYTNGYNDCTSDRDYQDRQERYQQILEEYEEKIRNSK